MILTVPIIFPVIQALQFDPIWFGVGIWPFMIAAMPAIFVITIFPEIAVSLPNHK